MNIINDELKIYKISLYLLGKSIFKCCKALKVEPSFFNDFVIQRNPSNSFRLKYCEGLTAEEIAIRENFSDERNVYKKIDSDMLSFGAWLSNNCMEAEAFESIRKRLETAISSEYSKRMIATADSKAWSQLRSDFLRALA